MSEELFKAIEDNDVSRVRSVIESLRQVSPRFHVDEPQLNRHTPMACAIQNNAFDVAIFLLSSGADARQQTATRHGNTLLNHLLQISRNDESIALVEKLIASGVDIQARTDGDHLTALHLAAKTDQPAITRTLIAAGLAVDQADEGSSGSAALHMAAHRDFVEVVRALLEAGANPDLKNKHGQTSLHRAAVNSCSRSIVLLMEAGADVHAKSHRGKTPLQTCTGSDSGLATIARLTLIAYGADPAELSDEAKADMRKGPLRPPVNPTMRQAAILCSEPKRLMDLIHADQNPVCPADSLPELVKFCAKHQFPEVRAMLQAEMARQAIDSAFSSCAAGARSGVVQP